jgi:hypothetical protein
MGGRNCESSPASDCLRTRDVPLSSPTFTAKTYTVTYLVNTDFKWPSTAALATKRAFHTSTLLPSGGILTCGGSDGIQTLQSCELWDPVTKEWDSTVASLLYPRALHTATLLPNGTVFVTGGTTGTASSTAALNTAEIFYPDTRRWVLTSSMTYARQGHTANLLPNGNVLVAGGTNSGGFPAAAEIFNAAASRWESAGAMTTARTHHTAVNTKDGNVIFAGGVSSDTHTSGTDSVERYNFLTNTWTPLTPLNTRRFYHSANLLRDGRVAVFGGSDNTGSIRSVEVFDPANPGSPWQYAAEMSEPRANHKSVLLPNGKVLVTGGEKGGVAYNTATSYEVDFGTWSSRGTIENRSNHTSVLRQDNYLMNIGGWNGSKYLDTCETFYFSYSPDLNGLEPLDRNPSISTGTPQLDRGQISVLVSSSSNFHGRTEASGGGAGARNSSFSNPRVYIQAVDIPTGFLTDLTTRLYSIYDLTEANSNWETTLSTLTVIIPDKPGELPYGWYHMRVAANGQFSKGHAVQITLPRPTGSVADIVGDVKGSTSVQWTWTRNDVSASDGYAVFSATNDVFIANTSFTDPALYVQTGLAPNTSIAIKVGAYNTGGYGPFEKSQTYNTLAVAPSSLTVDSANFETVALSWDSMGNSNSTIYEVTMSETLEDGNFPATGFYTPVPFNNNHKKTSATLTVSPNKEYFFRVQARNLDGIDTDYDDQYMAGNPVSTITVSNVSNLSGSALSVSAINWSWGPSDGSPSYELYEVFSDTGVLPVFLASTTLTNYTQVDLSTNTQHAVRVNAYKDTNKGPVAYSEEVFTLAAQPLPGVPQTFTSISTGSITLNWIHNGNPSSTLYRFNVSRTEDFAVTSTFTVIGTTVTLHDLDPNLQYYVRLRAINGDKESTDFVQLGSTYTWAQYPRNLRSTKISMSDIRLTWDTGANSTTTIYEVRGATGSIDSGPTGNLSSGPWINPYPVSFASAYTKHQVLVKGLLTATSYYFDVAAMNGAGIVTSPVQSGVVYTLPGPSGAPSGSLGGTSVPGQDVLISGTLPNNLSVTLTVPSRTVEAETVIAISSSVTSYDAAHPASNPTNPCGYLVGGKPLGVTIYTEGDFQPQVPVTLTLTYPQAETDITNYVSRLVMARYNPETDQCLPLDTIVDVGRQTITAKLNHFSIFQLMLKDASSNLSAVRVYPNPFYAKRGQGFVTLDNLPASAKIKIYTLSGVKVWEGTASTTGIITWDAVNKSGVLVGSGVYLALIDSSAGKKVVKIAVER